MCEYRGEEINWQTSEPVDAPQGSRLVIVRDAKGAYWGHVPELWQPADALIAFARWYVCDYSLTPEVFLEVRDLDTLVQAGRAKLDEDGEVVEISTRAWPFLFKAEWRDAMGNAP
ncbi:hypothetical protein LZC95_07815 [Pendulispora brunnea]|uniref:Uncharacterized protein n=1 Tax=Pendulispora brunnea TaxID=2905690 RepID=A0ABZ2KK48_9BACT